MLNSCGPCGVRNLPHAEACASCGLPLEPRMPREEWEALSPQLRADHEKASGESVLGRRRWLENLRARRGIHTASGALLFGVLMTLMYIAWWRGHAAWLAALCALQFIAGGAAGHLINTKGGGSLKGFVIFESTFLVSFALVVLCGWADFPTDGRLAHFTVRAFWLGSLAATMLGLGFGRYLAFDRYDPSQ